MTNAEQIGFLLERGEISPLQGLEVLGHASRCGITVYEAMEELALWHLCNSCRGELHRRLRAEVST